MRKGISSAISVLLILMISISMIGFAFIFLSRLGTQASNTSISQADNIGKSAQTMMKVDGIGGDSVYIRNVGSVPIANDTLGFYIDSSRVSVSIPQNISTGQIGDAEIEDSWKFSPGSHSLKITGAGADSYHDVYIVPHESSVAYTSLETSGNTIIDYYGNSYGYVYGLNNGTLGDLVPSSMPSWVAGKNGYGLEFRGDYVNFSSNSFLYPGTGSFTVEGWIYHINYSYPNTTFPIGDSSSYNPGNKGWEIGHSYNANGINVILNDGTNRANGLITFDAGYMPLDILNSWAHIVIVFNRTSGRAYGFVNGTRQSGQLDISSVTGDVTGTKDIRLGNMVGWLLGGTADEIRIYRRALSDSEVYQRYQGIETAEIRKGLAGEWNFDEGYGSIAKDSHMSIPGKFGNALQFTGSESVVTEHNGSISPETTVSLWFRISDWQNRAVLGRQSYDSITYTQERGWKLYRNATMAQGSLAWVFYYNISGGATSSISPVYTGLAADTWHHALISVKPDGSYSTYLNGVLNSSGSSISGFHSWGGTGYQTDARLCLGIPGEELGNNFIGAVDEVAVYSKALEPGQILSLRQ